MNSGKVNEAHGAVAREDPAVPFGILEVQHATTNATCRRSQELRWPKPVDEARSIDACGDCATREVSKQFGHCRLAPARVAHTESVGNDGEGRLERGKIARLEPLSERTRSRRPQGMPFGRLSFARGSTARGIDVPDNLGQKRADLLVAIHVSVWLTFALSRGASLKQRADGSSALLARRLDTLCLNSIHVVTGIAAQH